MKANDNCLAESIILPVPEIDAANSDMEIYARFMRHLRTVANSRMEIKVLTSIQFVADMLDLPDSQVTKVLVDMGLRAPRMALPSDFLDHVDASLMRDEWEVGAANRALRSLDQHWSKIGEDKFAAFKRFYPSLSVDHLERV